jgi:hypothetical protein
MYKLLYILIGYSICATLVIIVLIKKPSITYEISKLTQKTKRNRDSNIKNNITPTINVKPDKKAKKEGVIKRWKNKRLTKKQNK